MTEHMSSNTLVALVAFFDKLLSKPFALAMATAEARSANVVLENTWKKNRECLEEGERLVVSTISNNKQVVKPGCVPF